jgi:GTP-binding protein
VALNKIDVPEARELADLVAPVLRERGLTVLSISAVSREGLKELAFALAEVVQQARAARPVEEAERIVLRPRAVDDTGFDVVREGEAFRIRGERPERWVRQTDFSNDEAVGYLADRLARLGVEAALFEAGAEAGCEVRIGSPENSVIFDWEPTIEAGASGAARAPRGFDERLEGR